MGLKWNEMSDEKVALMVERHDAGESYSNLGREFGIDRRAVARAIRQFEEKRSGLAGIRRDAVVSAFQQHLDDMRKAARILLELTMSPSIRDSFLPVEPNIDVELVARVSSEFRTLYPGVFSSMPWTEEARMEKAQINLKERVDWRLAQRRGKAAIEGLRGHVPAFEDQLQKWTEIATGYKERWTELKEQALTVGVPINLIEDSVRLALEELSHWQRDEGLPWDRKSGTAIDTPEYFKSVLLERPATREPLNRFEVKLKEIETVYGKLEEMLGYPQLEKALVTGHCQFCPVP